MQRGDLVACTNKGILPWAIRFAQKRDHEEHWDINHIAVLNSYVDGSDNDWTVYQAEPSGITKDRLLSSVTPGGRHFIIPFPHDSANWEKFLAYLEAHVGDEYSWMSILSCAVDMILPDEVCLRRADTYICSGIVASALQYAGYSPMVNAPDIYTVTPATLISMLGVSPTE